VTTPKSAEPRSVELELRMPPTVLALYTAGFVAVVVVFVTQGFSEGGLSLLFPVFFLLILAINTARVLSRARAFADGSLEVRNHFRTRTVQRGDIDRVIVGQEGGLGSARRLELLLTDGTVLPVLGPSGLRSRARRSG